MSIQFFKSDFLTAASHNARIAGEIEDAYEGKEMSDVYRGEAFRRWQPIHDSHVMIAFISSYTAVEVAINEFLEDEMNWYGAPYEPIKTIIENFPGDFYRLSTLGKIQFVLAFSDADKFDQGEEPYQSVALIRRIRNNLVHYKPQYIVIEDGEPPANEISRALQTKNLDENPFRERGPLFPGGFLSYAYARWSVESVIEFLMEFYDRVGMRNPMMDKEWLLRELDTGWESTDPEFEY